ncbi:unnamed protein product [Fraxinus pennsylvanica]|uniref:Uncharacterized protein n=1 Tax=Fraxinus pennsylvanica TaxID=56036 RepID=A0AAD2ADW0_9LAMI|nr:unnamed protein product [Fraxinus pennsylvanica]
MNQNVYDPRIFAIGPFHHGEDHLCKMEQHKYMYLKLLLKRTNESTVDKFVAAVRSMEEKARNSYAEPLKFNQDEFVEILLLDGIFIIELLCSFYMVDDDENDIILQRRTIGCQLYHDLLLFDNQMPFFVLDQLFNMTSRRQYWFSNPLQLQEAGVVFQSARESIFWDIRFINGVMKIPAFDFTVDTETPFLNFIAYEDLLPSGRPRYFMDFSFFWSCLVNSSEDVGALRRCGIINNYLVDDEMVH